MTETLSVVIISCLLILALTALAKPLRVLLRFGISAVVGGFCLWLCSRMGLGVGVNPATLLTVGVLGTPGFAGLLVLSLLL